MRGIRTRFLRSPNPASRDKKYRMITTTIFLQRLQNVDFCKIVKTVKESCSHGHNRATKVQTSVGKTSSSPKKELTKCCVVK